MWDGTDWEKLQVREGKREEGAVGENDGNAFMSMLLDETETRPV